jgi:hypothetical protein
MVHASSEIRLFLWRSQRLCHAITEIPQDYKVSSHDEGCNLGLSEVYSNVRILELSRQFSGYLL